MITAGPNQQRQHGSFAVVRCYRPTRIERELLTQVFDIVQTCWQLLLPIPNCGFDAWRRDVDRRSECSAK